MSSLIAYWNTPRHIAQLTAALGEHVALVSVTLVCSLVLAAVITVIALRSHAGERVIMQVLSASYAIPSLALFSLLIPFTGLGFTSAAIVLVLYNQFILVQNALEGIHGVDASVVQAAQGMGMSPIQIMLQVQLPLALPALMGGLRLAALSTIGIATIASTIGAGGLGDILFSGLRTMNLDKILGGTLACAALALAADAALRLAEYIARKRLYR